MKKLRHNYNSFRWLSTMMMMVGLFFTNIQLNAQSTAANNTPVATVDNSTITSTATSTIPAGDIITGVTVDLEITHTWVGYLSATLTSPSGTIITLFEQPGAPATGNFGCSQDNIQATFDDAAANDAAAFESTCNTSVTGAGVAGGPFAISGSFQSIDALATLNGEAADGDWILSVNDANLFDGGFVEGFTVNISHTTPVGPGPCVATNIGMTCNDNIQASVDGTCQTVIGPDMILEGGGYCYDDYTVSINGGGNIVNPSMIGLTLSIEVTQISTGNSCWGTISVEDKIAPTIVCTNAILECDEELPSVPSPEVSGPQTILLDGLNDPIDDGGSNISTIYTFDYSYIPAGTPVQDVNVIANIEHAFTGDVNIIVTAPDGTTATAFAVTGCGGPFPINATFDDEGIIGADCFDLDQNGGPLQPLNNPGIFGPFLSALDGIDASGVWQIEVFDDFPVLDGGTIFAIGLEVTADAPANSGADGCGTPTLTYVDVVQDNECNGLYSETIVRTWTATDASGNASSCTSTYQRLRPTLADVVFPADADIDCTRNENEVYQNTNPSDSYTFTANLALVGKLVTGEPTGASCGGNINFTKHDHIVEICEGSYKVLRTWKAVDWCADAPDNILEGTQIVKVLDTTGPSIPAIAPISISPNSNGCLASTILPSLNATDDCSGSDISVSYTSTGGVINYDNVNHVYIISGLELGTVTVTATATDACGNESSIDFLINTEDNIAPIAICDEHTIASLGSDGYASIPALTFDDGSYDNCEIVEYKVRRMTDACHFPPQTGFGDYALFCCADLGSVVMVELRVRDAAGNTNSCMVEVEVQDKLKPTIVCPPNKTIDCDDDYTDLGLTGEAVASDNCSDVTPTHIDNVNIDNCGEGSVIRIWSVTDDSGNSASCVQIITVVNSDPFIIVDTECRTYDINPFIPGVQLSQVEPPVGPHSAKDDVEWPCDITLTTCGNGLQPSDLEANYPLDARPQVTEGYCDLIAVTYDDLQLPIQGDACLIILRTWIIIDWCNYDEANPYAGGRWEYVQVIKVINSEAPQVFPGGDSYVGNFEENCGNAYVELFVNATDDCTPTADLDFSYVITTAGGAFVDQGTNTNASGAFANGEYVITWTVGDGCANYHSAPFTFKVEDKKKPTPVCINGLSTVIMPSAGAVTIWASDFESGSSFDNCTPYSGLQFSFSSDVTETSRTFTCDEISASSQVTVEIWVTDGNGNQDFCVTYILVQDPNGACPPTATAAVAGGIQTEEGDDVEDVTVTLMGSNEAPITTGANGAFNFPNMAGTNYVVTPTKDMNPLNGVTTFDLVLISKHILGTQALGTPYKMIAADANASNTITTFDIVTLRRLILQIDTDFANNDSWRFVASNYAFPDVTNPWSEVFPETVNLETSNATDFVGVKIGDVNGSASPNSLLGTDTRTFDGNLVLNIEDTKVAAGEEFAVDFKASDFNNMLGYQFTLAFENAEFVDVTTSLEKLGTENFGLSMVEEGIITTSWNTATPVKMNDDAVLFTLTFKATAATQLSEVLSLSSRYTVAEAYTSNEDLYNVALSFNGEVATADFKVYQNTPNPFKEVTTIGFNLPAAATTTLRVFDVTGKVLTSMEVEGAKGYNMVELNRGQLSATGVLYYQVETANHTATMKMILVD